MRARLVFVALLIVAVAAVMELRADRRQAATQASPSSLTQVAPLSTQASPKGESQVPPAARLPRLLDLGASTCVPCKMMEPILEELRHELAGRVRVEFIDVWKDPVVAEPYEVRVIPTQIFFDATGRERFRHTGFFSKEDILATWRDLGVELTPEATPPQ